ncbi:MAG TPA: hypothetical protein VGL23_09310 [Chloroflexota bacterium]|jgi:hypothetical protein
MMFRKPTTGLARLQAEGVVELPARQALSLVNANLALPINAALAANVLSDSSVAYGSASQNTPINQGMMMTPPLGG